MSSAPERGLTRKLPKEGQTMSASVLRFPSQQNCVHTFDVADTPHIEQRPKAWWRAIGWFLGRVVLFVCFIPLAVIWSLLMLCFFVVKWVAIIAIGADLLYQFFRMLYCWHTPGMHPGWTFLLHYGVITAVGAALYMLALLIPSSGSTHPLNNNVREPKIKRIYWKPPALWLLFRSNKPRY